LHLANIIYFQCFQIINTRKFENMLDGYYPVMHFCDAFFPANLSIDILESRDNGPQVVWLP